VLHFTSVHKLLFLCIRYTPTHVLQIASLDTHKFRWIARRFNDTSGASLLFWRRFMSAGHPGFESRTQIISIYETSHRFDLSTRCTNPCIPGRASTSNVPLVYNSFYSSHVHDIF